MDLVAIYARVSTEENQLFDRQISDLKRVIINEHGYKDNQIVIYAEKKSGYLKNRPELIKMLEKAEDYKCIYVTEVSRLGRNPSHTRQTLDELTEKKIPVYIHSLKEKTLKPDGTRNYLYSIVLQILMEIAHAEAETLKERFKSGKIESITKKGGVATSNPAYGYKNVDKKIVIDEDESAVVRMIFNLCNDGYGTHRIANRLNELGIPTRRSISLKEKGMKARNTDVITDASNIKWTDVTIRQIIKNPIYYGKGIINKIRTKKDKAENTKVEIIYDTPVIISEELHKECNEIITSRITKGDAIYTYLLKNLMYCGVCGNKYFGMYTPTTKASKVYKCTSNTKQNLCCNSSPSLFFVESVFYNIFSSTDITDYIDNTDDVKEMLIADLDRISSELETLRIEKQDKETEQKRIIKLYASGKYPESVLDEMNDEVENEINSINDKFNIKKDKQLELKSALLNYDEEITSKEMLINAKENRLELRNIYKQLISKVIVNRITDEYTLLTYFIKLNGLELPNPIKIVINNKSARKNPHTHIRKYKYIEIKSLENEPFFMNNILKTEIDTINDINYCIEQANINEANNINMLMYSWNTVKEENHLYINAEMDK
jgi:site-specific DNA recombinase